MNNEAAQLIPELSAWNNGNGIDLVSWTACIGRYDHALGYAAIFWPHFEMYDGCVFLARPDPTIYQDWMVQFKSDRTAVESMLNHRHIIDLFPNSEFPPTKEIVLHVGRLLKNMWMCKLVRDFPDCRVKVEFTETESDDWLTYIITLFQERN